MYKKRIFLIFTIMAMLFVSAACGVKPSTQTQSISKTDSAAKAGDGHKLQALDSAMPAASFPIQVLYGGGISNRDWMQELEALFPGSFAPLDVAGSFDPNALATREFAAHSLNAYLHIILEEEAFD